MRSTGDLSELAGSNGEDSYPYIISVSSQHFTPHMPAISRKLEEDATPTRHLHLHRLLKKRPLLFFKYKERRNLNKFPLPWMVISKQLKGWGVSMELGQPYFIKRLDMCNPAFLYSE